MQDEMETINANNNFFVFNRIGYGLQGELQTK